MGKIFQKLSLCMTLILGLLLPGLALASVDAINQFPGTPVIVSNANTAAVSGKYTVAAGSNRLMLVAVAIESTTAPTVAVTYGGQTVTQILLNTTGANKLWLGRLNEAGIVAAGTNKTLSATLTGAGTITATYVTAAVYGGVDQTTPITGSNSLGTTAAALTIGPVAYTMTGNAGLAGNNGLSVYLVNWNNATVGQTSPAAGYTEVRDYVGANFSLSANYKVTTGASSESITSTTTASSIAALAAVGLNPAVRVATNSACSDCHGYPPADTTARNVPPGQFAGSHDKHAGNQDQLNQYGQACTVCHYNAVGYNHQTGFKNITGSRLPGNAYQYGKKIAITNTPTLGTCSNTTCHSTGRANIQYSTTPVWGGAATNCLSCHAGRAGTGNGAQANSAAGFKLSSSHSQHLKYPAANVNCNMCHGSVAAFDGTNLTLKNYSSIVYHADGTANVTFRDITYGSYTAYKPAAKTCNNISCHGGKSRGTWQNTGAINTNHTCTHCHGVPTGILSSNTDLKNYAPGWNGTGTSTDQGPVVTTDPRIGAHFVHLSSVYMQKIKCNECHIVPATAFSGTHMTGTRFNSQTVTFSQASTAIKNGLTSFVSYTAGTATKAVTCSTTYCHGNKMIQGDTAGTYRKPSWNQDLTGNTPNVATCGRCHGLPPNSISGSHNGLTAVTQCAGCHAAVVNASGAIINKLLHINGVNNFLVQCNGCHDYDTRSGGTVWGAGGPYAVEGYGAHAKHIEYLKTRGGVITTLNPNGDTFGGAAYNATCGVCHTQTETGNHTTGGGGTRTINFNASIARQFGVATPVYNGVVGQSSSVNPKSCSNIDCHYKTSPIWSTY